MNKQINKSMKTGTLREKEKGKQINDKQVENINTIFYRDLKKTQKNNKSTKTRKQEP